jgi:Protein of unknown function (DUF1353)
MNKFIHNDVTLIALNEQEILQSKYNRAILNSTIYRTVSILQFDSVIARGIITIPIGFLTDLASIPNIAQGVFMKHDDPIILRGSIIEKQMLLTRQECDWILTHECMASCGASDIQIDTVYDVLRLFGAKWGPSYTQLY